MVAVRGTKAIGALESIEVSSSEISVSLVIDGDRLRRAQPTSVSNSTHEKFSFQGIVFQGIVDRSRFA